MLEHLTAANLNDIDSRILFAEKQQDKIVTLYTCDARALYDLARRAPLPAVDRHLDELEGQIGTDHVAFLKEHAAKAEQKG